MLKFTIFSTHKNWTKHSIKRYSSTYKKRTRKNGSKKNLEIFKQPIRIQKAMLCLSRNIESNEILKNQKGHPSNGGLAVLVHHGIVRKWRCGSWVTLCSLSFVIVYDVSIVIVYDVSIVIVYDVTLLLSMTYQFQSRLRKTDCTDLWVIKLTNQVSPSIGFQVPHWYVKISHKYRKKNNKMISHSSEYKHVYVFWKNQ